MSILDRPRIRPLQLRAVRHEGGDFIACEDPTGSFEGQVLVPRPIFRAILRHCDGGSTREEIRILASRELGIEIAEGEIHAVLERLDRALVLDGPSFQALREAYAGEAIRPAALAGRSYPSDPARLRAWIDGFFADPRGSGPPSTVGQNDGGPGLRAILCPHIDFTRGGPTYTWAYRELVENSDADTFVILGVAHHGTRNRFALTRKDFATPLGLVPTDRDFLDRIVAVAGPNLYDDEMAHRNEHSIEFQAVFLQHLLGDRRPFRIVPILVGSFHDLMESGRDPIDDPEVSRMVAALEAAEAKSGRKVAYIGAIDLCHVGPEFGDPDPVDDGQLDQIHRFDESMLDRAEAVDPHGWFARAAEVQNRWRVCGLAATYTLLHAIGPARGRSLRYGQAVDPTRTCCVSFASVAYETSTAQGTAT
ncbi:AmmeMemoRadiSam system protein B [Tundrisphaera sp. TA3]|uniref:AmmeMemoRadiSam system protein B n=1 Tax=Tundrisphaera sp. TA3 TaxID=3435775 RepID=UPI003EB7918D